MKGLLGRKLGMTEVFDEGGDRIPVTVLEGGPCPVLAVKTQETDGYDAVTLGFGEKAEKACTRPEAGTFKKMQSTPKKFVQELRTGPSDAYQLGQILDVECFVVGDYVDVTGITIGKGFQGGVKRWHWKGGKASHGSMHHRAPGSIGSSSDPSRVFKGHHLPGHMGDRVRTVQGLLVVLVDKENQLLLVKGAVPGKDGYVVIRLSHKKRKEKKVVQPIAEKEPKKEKKPEKKEEKKVAKKP